MRLWRTSLVSRHFSQCPLSVKIANVIVIVGFALAAALAQVLAPRDAQIVNLLGYHVIAKLLVHYPSYLSNVALPRTAAHVTATAALINICWRLAAGN